MTRMRWFYAAFWIVVASMLLWQFQSYNKHIDQAIATAGPKQQHFYFLNGATNAASTTDAPPKPDGADVKQVNFSYTDDSPAPGSFTCHVTLKNYGNMKATGISVQVSPFQGALQDVDNDGRVSPNNQSPTGIMNNNNPIAQVSQWVDVPDIAPNETQTVDVVFASQKACTPGDNANPAIRFKTVNPTSAP